MAHVLWQPAPRFVEAATALAVAYLALEILMFPQAGARWLVAFVLGALHGLYFHLFVQTTGYGPALVLVGATLAEAAAIALLALVLSRVGRMAKAFRPVQVAASGLLIFGSTVIGRPSARAALRSGRASTDDRCTMWTRHLYLRQSSIISRIASTSAASGREAR